MRRHRHLISSADGRATALWTERLQAETDVVSAVMADPAKFFPLAHRAGCTASLFVDPACRSLWLSTAVLRGMRHLRGNPKADRFRVVMLAKVGLRHVGEWDAESGPERLAELATCRPWSSPSFVATAAASLVSTSSKLSELSSLTARYEALMSGAA